MSFSLSRHDHDHPAAAPLDLLDEYWFFSNTLNNNGNKKKPTRPTPTTKPQPQGAEGWRRRLLRTPSLPPPRIPDSELAVEEQADDDLNWSSIYEGILRARTAAAQGNSSSSSRSCSALQRAPSMPVAPSSEGGRRRCSAGKEKEMPGTGNSNNNNKLRHSYSTLESKQQQAAMMMMMKVRSKKTTLFHQAADKKKKWKSSSDLESIEVQGFKDLGFVFDEEELREDLADVLPGLNKNASAHGAVRRPYLSEAWHHDRRRPALIRVQSEARSAAEMKDQLRMWAQAVACNARQECAS